MRLEELTREGESQGQQAATLSEVVREHQETAEQLRALEAQLDRIEGTLTSSHLEEARGELERSLDHISAERAGAEQKRLALLQENLELMNLCETALGKAKTTLEAKDSFLSHLGRGIGAEVLKVGAGVLTGFFKNDPFALDAGIDSRLGKAAEATKRHVERLEGAKKQLLETRKLLEREPSAP